MKILRVCFVGHRQIENFNQIETKLKEEILPLFTGYDFIEFFVGRNGDFDILVASTIKSIQKEYYPNQSVMTLVLPYPLKDITYYEKYYDDILILNKKCHYKQAITKRNQWLVDNSDLIICYIEHKYGGAYQCFNYAYKNNISIINLSNTNENLI